MEDYDLPESKFGKIYKVAGPRKLKIRQQANLSSVQSAGRLDLSLPAEDRDKER